MKQPPFKVFCIGQPVEWLTFSIMKAVTIPDVGDEVTVIQIYNAKDGRPKYILGEHSDRTWFAPQYFATLPEATADEMAEAEKESIVNLETAIV